MALPNLTAINIYLADNTLWRTIELAGDCKYIDELEGDERVELKWESYDYEKIPVGSYVIYDNRVFRLTEPHEPSRRMENVFTYSPTFYTESYHWRKAMACYYEYSGEVTYTNSDNTISANIPEPTSRELDWSFTGNLPDALFMLLQAIKNETGSVWKAHYDSSVANQLIEITAQGLSVRDMLTQIADQCGKEFYFDYSGATPVVNIGTLELTASGEHTEDGRIVLNIGEDVGNPTVNSEAEEYFTRFYFFGSTRNIEQPTSVTKSSVVNRRLPLLSSASGNNNYYPKGFIDISGGSYVNHAYTPSLPDYKVFAKSVFFDDIYPHASYKVLSVQKAYIPVKDDANQPTGERMPIYYVALYDSNDANRQAIAFNDWVGEKNGVEGQMVPTLVPSIAFRGGYLQGLEYELIYHRAGDKVSTYAADGTKSQLTLTANCFEIVFDTNANPRLPNDTIFPRGYTAGTYDGDDCTLFNIKMPASYILNAQLELETKALQYIADLNVDKSTYEMVSDADNFERVTAFKELQLGHKVKMIYPQIIGRNLIQTQLLSYSTNRGIKGENVGDGWIKLSGTLTTGRYPEILSILKNFNEDNTIAAEENYTLSVVDESGILSSNGIRVVVRVNVSGSTTHKNNYSVSSTPVTINMTGGWLARLSLYCEGNKSGIEINGRIRIKLEKGAVAHPWTPAPEENGQSVLSRVISIERCLDLPCDCGITLGYSAKQGNIKTLREIIADTSDKTETVIREGEKNKAQILGLRNGYRAQQEALDTYFDPDGSFDGSRIKPETIQTGALAVGAKSQQFTLSGVQMSVAKYSSGNGTLSWVCDSGKLAHFSLDDEYTLIWPMATGTQALNNANAHYIYAKCAKDGFGAASGGIKTNSNSGTFVATAEQIKFDSDNNYYYFLVGTVSSAQTDSDSTYKTRIISMTYGMTTINGKQITTGVIRSSDSNHGVVINLDTGEIIGKIKFRTSQGTDVNAETYIGETAEAAAKTAVDNLEIGGRNLLAVSKVEISNNSGLTPSKLADGWFHIEGTITGTSAGLPRPLWGEYTEANTIAKDGIYTLSIETRGTMPISDKYKVQIYSYASGGTSNGSRQYITTPNGKLTIDLTGRWLLRVVMYKTADATGTVVNGDIRFKLEKGNKATDWTPAPEDTEAELAALQADLQNQIDGKIETWSQVADPSSAWTTTALKDKHINDLWYYTGESTDTRTNNMTYKYTKSGSTYLWAEYSAGGGDLFDRIDGKAAIFYGSPSGTYEDVEEGDFLVDGKTGISYKRLNNAWVKVQDYQEAIANIKIGGRNLHKDSESLGSSWIKTNATVSDGVATLTRTSTEARVYQMSASAYWTWNADTEYAVSVEAKAEVSGVKLQIDPYGANATPKNIELTTEWKRYTFVFKSGTSVTSGSISYRANDNNSVIYVRKPKLEEGNKASAWTPAPEDVDAGISNAQSAAAAAQQSANTANTTISNMNNDTVFSKLEKKSFRVEWKNIQGTVTADTTYTNDGSYAKAIAAVNGTTVGHGTLDAAYTNLKNYLIKWKLDTNEDTDTPASGSGTFSQGDLGAVTAAYYNAETALYDALADYWSEQQAKMAVDNLVIGGANLLPTLNVWENGSWNASTGAHSTTNTSIRCTKNNYFIPITASTDYVISRHTLASASKTYQIVIYAYDSSGNFVSADSKTSWQSTFPIKYKSATATRLEIGIRHSDDSAITADEAATARIQIEKGNKATDWKPAAADTEAEIAVERARLDNIDSDTVFSVSEKENYRTDFEKIVGLGIPVAGYIPTAAELAAGSYNHGGTTYDCSKGTFYQHYSLINTTAINTLGAMSTAYTNLRDFLVEVGLYVNTDYGTPLTPFSRTALAELICTYLDAESDVAFYAENVSALEGECNMGTTATSKRINCYQVPKATMLQDMLADVDMKMRVTFKYGNTVATPTFSFRNDGGMTPTAFVPTGCSSYELNFYYNGATTNNKCYWLDGMVFELKYRSATSTAVTLECVDESSLKAGLMIASSLKGTTTIEGGLVLTRSILMQDNEDNVTAGITGLKESGVAVFAGGTLAEALAGLASVIINRDGLAKFGKVYIDGRSSISQLYMVDSMGKTRFLLRSGSLKIHPAVKVYNSGNNGDDGTRESTSATLVANATTAHQTYNLFALANMTGSGTNPQNYNYSFQINIQLKVSMTSNGNSYYGFTYVDIQYYDGNGWNSAASYSIRNDFADSLEETVNVNVPYSNNVTPAQRGLRVVYWKDNAQASHNTEIEVDTVSWCYFGELSDRLMQIAANGLEYFYDTNNLFKVRYSGGKLTTSIFGDVEIKGNTDIAGVLWAGRIGKTSGFDSFYKNSAKYASNDIAVSHTSGQATYTITHRLGTDEYSVSIVPIDSSTTRSFRISARGTSTFTITFSAETEFFLTIFGKN